MEGRLDAPANRQRRLRLRFGPFECDLKLPNRRLLSKALRLLCAGAERPVPSPSQPRHRIRRRPPQQESLCLIRPQRPNQLQLFLGLDSFDNHSHAEVMPHRQYRLDKRPAFRPNHQPIHEGAIDLNRIERQLGQITQAGVSSAEVRPAPG